MYQQFDPFFALLFPRLLSFIENRKKIQSNHLLRYKPNIYKRHVLQSSSLLLASLVNTIPQRPVLCDSLPFSSNTSSTPESLQQELIDFCNKHSIPNECRPKWTKLKGQIENTKFTQESFLFYFLNHRGSIYSFFSIHFQMM